MRICKFRKNFDGQEPKIQAKCSSKTHIFRNFERYDLFFIPPAFF